MDWNIEIDQEMHDLPLIYWMPKIHKNPSKHRFIAASKQCSTKPLSLILTRILKVLQSQHINYCKAIKNYSGFNRFWIIDNSCSVLDLVKKCNLNSVNNIRTYDFSTLYTSIPHSKLKGAIAWVINKAFIGKNKKYINLLD